MTRQFSAACCLGVLVGVGRCADPQPPGARSSPRADDFRHYVDDFNPMVPEEVVNAVPNAQSWGWLEANVPFFACPDRALEQTYYYRWWALRKHIKRTPKRWVFTEFLRPVRHGTEYNAISCALGHHILEGRWIRDRQYVEQYVRFWLQSGENGGLQKDYHKYSSWTAAAVYEAWLVHQDRKAVVSLLDSLVLDFHTWEMERVLENWLFWQIDVRDGMEESVSGSRRDKNARPTINSYMYGNARAIAAVARLRGDAAVAREFEAKAERLKRLVLDRLWDAKTRFFKPLREGGRPGRRPRDDRLHAVVLSPAGRRPRVRGRLGGPGQGNAGHDGADPRGSGRARGLRQRPLPVPGVPRGDGADADRVSPPGPEPGRRRRNVVVVAGLGHGRDTVVGDVAANLVSRLVAGRLADPLQRPGELRLDVHARGQPERDRHAADGDRLVAQDLGECLGVVVAGSGQCPIRNRKGRRSPSAAKTVPIPVHMFGVRVARVRPERGHRRTSPGGHRHRENVADARIR